MMFHTGEMTTPSDYSTCGIMRGRGVTMLVIIFLLLIKIVITAIKTSSENSRTFLRIEFYTAFHYNYFSSNIYARQI